MPFELVHFRGSDEIIKDKNLEKDVRMTLEYVNDALYGSLHRRELMRQALDEMDWRDNGNVEWYLRIRANTSKWIKAKWLRHTGMRITQQFRQEAGNYLQ